MELESKGQTAEYRTINTVVEGDVVNEANLKKQKQVLEEMKSIARSKSGNVS